MSCFPCFGGGKGKEDGEAETTEAAAPPSNMTPPPAVQAPDAYSAASAAALAAAASPKPGGANNADQSSADEASLRQAITAQAFAFRELAAATDHFTPYNLVGEGGFFRVYKGKLEKSEQTVAIKQLDKHGFQDNKAFLTGVAMLSQLHHENLVDIVGYCADGDQRLLVYESVPAGTLEDHLFADLSDGKKPMDWCTRMKVAHGAAQGLEYLHDKARPPVVYGEFKASHILLDENLTPNLSDLGIAQLGQAGGDMPVASPMMGSFGCCTAEYDRSGQATMKSDVYSFGVVLVQLISGRRAVDTSKPVTEQNVVTWAMLMFKDQKRYPAKALNQVVDMAAICLQEEDSVRPLMADIIMTLGFLTSMPPDPAAPAAPPADTEPKKEKGSDHSDSSLESLDDEGNEEEEEAKDRGNNKGQEANRLLLGLNCARPLETITLPEATMTRAETHNFDVQAFRFSADKEFLMQPRVVRVGLIQNLIVVPTPLLVILLSKIRLSWIKLDPSLMQLVLLVSIFCAYKKHGQCLLPSAHVRKDGVSLLNRVMENLLSSFKNLHKSITW